MDFATGSEFTVQQGKDMSFALRSVNNAPAQVCCLVGRSDGAHFCVQGGVNMTHDEPKCAKCTITLL